MSRPPALPAARGLVWVESVKFAAPQYARYSAHPGLMSEIVRGWRRADFVAKGVGDGAER
jgi:hypothetical protein